MSCLPLHYYLCEVSSCGAMPTGLVIRADNAAGHGMNKQHAEEETFSLPSTTVQRSSSMDGTFRWDTGTSCYQAPKLLVETTDDDLEDPKKLVGKVHPAKVTLKRASSTGSLLDDRSNGSRWQSSSPSSSDLVKKDGAAKLPRRRKNQDRPPPSCSTSTMKKQTTSTKNSSSSRGLDDLLTVLEDVENDVQLFFSSSNPQLEIPSELFCAY